jgi:hypothetical protein
MKKEILVCCMTDEMKRSRNFRSRHRGTPLQIREAKGGRNKTKGTWRLKLFSK